jgi:hypothetical protein
MVATEHKSVIGRYYIPALPGFFALKFDPSTNDDGTYERSVWREPIIAWEVLLMSTTEWDDKGTERWEKQYTDVSPVTPSTGFGYGASDHIEHVLYPDGRVLSLYVQDYKTETEWADDQWPYFLESLLRRDKARKG